jgi:hypothetical protein
MLRAGNGAGGENRPRKLERDVTDGARTGPIPERESGRKPIRAQSRRESGYSHIPQHYGAGDSIHQKLKEVRHA